MQLTLQTALFIKNQNLYIVLLCNICYKMKLFIESSKQRVMEVMFKHPTEEFSLSDLAKLARVAKPHIGKILKELQQSELIEIKKLSKIWRIKALQNDNFIKNKIIYNLHLLFQSNIIPLIDELYNHPKAIILFGSYRKGEDIIGSDIDIAVEVEKNIEIKSLSLKQLLDEKPAKIVDNFENDIKRQIQIYPFNKKNIDIHVFNNIANGIILSGFLEVKP